MKCASKLALTLRARVRDGRSDLGIVGVDDTAGTITFEVGDQRLVLRSTPEIVQSVLTGSTLKAAMMERAFVSLAREHRPAPSPEVKSWHS